MILVTLGTQEFPFERVLREVDRFPQEEVVVQCGRAETRPARAVWHDYLPFEELVEHVRRARVVVCHAGVGSVTTALANGRRPVVVPRLRRYREAVDDHQLPFARRLAAASLVTLVEEPTELPAVLAGGRDRSSFRLDSTRLALDLHEHLRELVQGRYSR